MKYIITFVTLIITSLVYGQSQRGIIAETNYSFLSTDDFEVINNGIGYGIGYSKLFSLNNTADFIFETSISRVNFSTKESLYSHFDSALINNDYPSHQISVDLLANQYIIAPELNKINFAIQGGFGMALIRMRQSSDSGFEESAESGFNTYPIIGINTGTEQLRFSLKYKYGLSNIFSNLIKDDGTEFHGKLSSLSFSLTYYFNSFSH